jgi:hypothetical protein
MKDNLVPLDWLVIAIIFFICAIVFNNPPDKDYYALMCIALLNVMHTFLYKNKMLRWIIILGAFIIILISRY